MLAAHGRRVKFAEPRISYVNYTVTRELGGKPYLIFLPPMNPRLLLPGVWTSNVLLLACAAKIVVYRLTKEMKAFGLDARTGWVLMAVEEKPQNQALVGKSLDINPNSMVKIVDRMEAGGFLKRIRNPVNRREYIIAATPKGRAILRKIHSEWDARTLRLFYPLPDEARAMLANFCQAIMDTHFKS
jgi:DNA-binding MarR family transcriptional regulator